MENQSIKETTPVPIYPPQIPYNPIWDGKPATNSLSYVMANNMKCNFYCICNENYMPSP
jgi:hypothetical protein